MVRLGLPAERTGDKNKPRASQQAVTIMGWETDKAPADIRGQ